MLFELKDKKKMGNMLKNLKRICWKGRGIC
jgi:hypothetical protein